MTTLRSQSYSVASGGTVNAGKVNTNWPTWRKNMLPRTWAVVPMGNTLASVDPKLDPTLNCNYPASPPWTGSGGHASVYNAYSGPTPSITKGELYLEGGGHGDYGGNELYKLDLMLDSPLWYMIRRPSGSKIDVGIITSSWYTGGDTNSSFYQDGRFRSEHSYADSVHIGGNKLFRPRGGPIGYGQLDTAPICRIPHYTDLINGDHVQYPNFDALAVIDDNGAQGGGAAYDKLRNVVWHIGVTASTKMLRTKLSNGVTTAHGVKNTYGGGVSMMTYSPSLDLVLYMGSDTNPIFSIFNPSTLSWSRIHPVTNSVPSRVFRAGTGGMVWVESLGAIAFWDNSTETEIISILKPPATNPFVNAWTWDQITPDVTNTVFPTARDTAFPGAFSTYNKFGYLHALRGFYLQSKYANSMFFFSLE